MDQIQKQPGFIVAILALLGLFSLPQVIKPPDAGTPRVSPDKQTASLAAPGDDKDDLADADRRDLKPLLDYLWDGQPKPSQPPDLRAYLCEKLCDTQVHCLLITVPEPVASVASAGLMNTWT